MSSTDNLPTTTTQERISDLADQPAVGYTEEEIDRAITFFARIATIYGYSRAKTLWGESDAQYQLLRREWAHQLGEYTHDQLETVFARLKGRLAAGDPDFKFPDVARILALHNDPDTPKAQRVHRAGLPEPEWRRAQRYACGALAAQTARAVLAGRAMFLEDKPNADH